MRREGPGLAAAAMAEEEENEPSSLASPSFRAPFAPLYESSAPPPVDGGSDFVFDDDDFEFVAKDPETRTGLTAEDIFSTHQIYPVFGRVLPLAQEKPHESPGDEENKAGQGTLLQLLMEDRAENLGAPSSSSSSSSSASSGTDGLEGIPPESYCVWTPSPSASPSPRRCRKSGSTGTSLGWRLRDLVVGRSQSDGKEKFVFLAAEEKRGKASPSRETKRGDSATKREKTDSGAKVVKAAAAATDLVKARRVFYEKGLPAEGGAGRRSFLPYKRDLLGFFASVNGITRTHHPF